MFMKILIVLASVFSLIVSQNYDSAYCYDRLCPSGTSACKKVVKSVQNEFVSNTIIYCLDDQDLVLQEFLSSGRTPYRASTSFDSISYASVDNQPRYRNANYY